MVKPTIQGDIQISESEEAWEIKAGEGISAELSKKNGLITGLSKKGTLYLKSGGRPDLNRPITGLDVRPGWGWYDDYEKVRRLEHRIVSCKTLKGDGSALFEFDFVMEKKETPPIPVPAIAGKITYAFDASGRILTTFSVHVDSGIVAVPRVGVELVLATGFEDMEYYGYGPIENYPDRLLSGILAVHRSTVTGQHFPFAPPSETGGHEKTRWLKLIHSGGGSLKISSPTAFHFDARHSTTEDYLSAAHDHELIRRGETFVHIDAAHGPIGSEMAWSSVMPTDYALGPGSYYLEFIIETA
jgi:beta-galactosidase